MQGSMTRVGKLLSLAAGLIAGLATDASAQAARVPVAGFAVVTEVVDPGTVFVSEEGIVHVRNQVNRSQFFGDLEGEQLTTGNLELDPVTGAGRTHGVVSFVGTHVPSGTQGTFFGSFAGDIARDFSVPCGIVFQVRGTAEGGEGFDGMKRSLDAVNACGFLTYEGEILDPSGTLQP